MSKTKTAAKISFYILMILLISVVINLILVRYQVNFIDRIFLDDNNVVITQYAYDKLNDIYVSKLEVEIPVCLAGEVKEDGILVTDIFEPEIISNNISSVVYRPCPQFIGVQKTIGTLHNHPSGYCALSNQDVETYVGDKVDGQTIIGLYCGKYVFHILTMLESEIAGDTK